MRILLASAEVAPFARVGGLSDVVGALAKDMAAAGHEVSVFLPRYAAIDGEKFGIERVAEIGSLAVRMGDRDETVEIHRSEMPGGAGVSVYYVWHEGYFGRDGIYVDPETGEGYPDEVSRYALFSRALILAARELKLRPDVIHLNDHHTALAAAYLREYHRDDPDLGTPGIVFSIHNLGYQGIFDKGLLPELGIPAELAAPGGPLEFHGQASAMKLGIELADYVNTVSERYAVEISSTAEFGLGLEGVLGDRRKADRLVGILNGVDYTVWDPSVDPLIPARYSADDIGGKRECKMALLERSKLEADPSRPLIGMVSRLADQKGFDLIREAADAIVELGAAVVVLGTGQQEYHEFLADLADRHRGAVAAHLAFDNELAHWIEAGSDMFLMPSLYEPCGLNQMYSLRYGTVPIVRETGGLADTVDDFDPALGTGTGFVFQEYSSGAMLETIGRSVDAYRDPTAWAGIVARGMALDYSWTASAARYAELYERSREAAVAREAAPSR